jgi:hypothetical protein
MKRFIPTLIILFILSFTNCEWNCSLSKQEAISIYKTKKPLSNSTSFDQNPYSNQTESSWNLINSTLRNKNIVCAFKYVDENRIFYELKNFNSKEEAEANKFTVTHQGRCGVCSNLNDLAVYLEDDSLKKVGKCGLLASISKSLSTKCHLNLGYTLPCAEISIYQSLNSIKYCSWICVVESLKFNPLFNPDGSPGKCMQCDKEHSDDLYRYFAGRTRRNSGIESFIKRSKDELYNMTHCYY